jgi:hypothetical protein
MTTHPESYQIKSRLFCAGLVVRQDGVITAAAPVIWEKIKGKTLVEVQEMCRVAGWKLEKI